MAVGFHVLHCDHEMGEFAIAQKDVADVFPLKLDLVKPGLICIFLVFQRVGAHVGYLPAPPVDEPQIDESGKTPFHGLKDPVECVLIGQILEGVGRGDETDRRGPLRQKHLEGVLGLVDHGLERGNDLGLERALV